MKGNEYRRYGCKMGCGCFKCKNDTPSSKNKGGKLARKIMKHINKVRQLAGLSRELRGEL